MLVTRSHHTVLPPWCSCSQEHASRQLESSASGSSDREAQLSTRIKQMEAALQAAASAADESYKREGGYRDTINQLQLKASQAAGMAASAA